MKRFVLALAALIALARDARAANKPIDVYSIWYSADTSHKLQVEQFHGCLLSTSSFPTWATQWNIGPFVLHPAIVLTTSPPDPLQITGSLMTDIGGAMTNGRIPQPTADRNTVILVHGPMSVTNEDDLGKRFCYQSQFCAEHWPASAPNGYVYQISLVPLDCPVCGGTLNEATWGDMHELAEAAADLGNATFEVADACESHPNQLQCCGNWYDTQWLDNWGGPGSCTALAATNPSCACGGAGASCANTMSCCDGLVCATETGTCCFEDGQTCWGPSDCCGALTCTNGKCTCVAEGESCVRNSDCCGNDYCDPQAKQCEPAPPQDGGADASDGTGFGPGCSCRAAAMSSRSEWPLLVVALLASARARSRRRRET